MAAVVLFSLEQLPTDVIALGILLSLVLPGLLPAERAFAGFGSDTVIMIFGLLVLTASLRQTGVVDVAGRELLRLTGDAPERLLLVLMVTSAVLSALISNTATAALLVPVTLGLARQTKVPASRLLMPLAFAAILSSSVTLVSTSTNLVISGMITQYDMAPLGMFELTPVGIPILLVGLAYMMTVGKRLIPQRGVDVDDDSQYGIHPYLAEIVIQPKSSLAGKTLKEAALGRDRDLTVLRVVRDKDRYLAPRARLELQAGDQLLVKGQRDQILRARDAVNIRLKGDVEISDPRLQSPDMQIVEVILLPQSPLTGRTLKTLRFRQRYGLNVLGVNRRGKNIYRKLSQTRLQTGDQLLVQGPRANIAALDEDNFHVIGPVEHQRPNRRRAPIAVGIFASVLLLTAFNVLSLPVAVTLGTAGVFVTRCITPDEAYRQVSWQALIVIGCMLALGSAMEHTGTAEFLATQLVQTLGVRAGPRWLLTLFFGMTMGLTQPMSNQAAAVLVLPIAVQTAHRLNLNPRTFAAMIAVGASCSFITPLEPACLMVYSAGRYKFMDFVKVGSLLTVIIYLIAIVLVPMLWPLGG
jgi:di/tricarboxylate transporter